MTWACRAAWAVMAAGVALWGWDAVLKLLAARVV